MYHLLQSQFQLIGVSDAINLQTVLNAPQCIKRPREYEFLLCPTSLIATDVDVWKKDRRALNPAFNPKMLHSYVPKINEKTNVLVDRLSSVITEKSDIDLYHMIFKSFMDIVISTTMSVDMQMQSPCGDLFYRMAKLLMSNMQRRVVRIWLRWNFVYRLTPTFWKERWAAELANQLMKLIQDRKIDEMNRQNYDVLECGREKNALNVIERCFLQQREGNFSEQNITDQMTVIITAGVDTSSMAVFSTLLLLAMHPEHQDKVVKELIDILEDADCDVTHEHASRMTYLECAIKEALRLFPPAPMFFRQCSDDVVVTCGKIPKGTIIVTNIAHLHRNPTYWGPLSNQFDPTRFLPENSMDRPLYSYLPFSGGPRNCIGLKYAYISTKIVIARLLRKFKFTTDLKIDEIRTKLHIVLEISNEYPLKIERRTI